MSKYLLNQQCLKGAVSFWYLIMIAKNQDLKLLKVVGLPWYSTVSLWIKRTVIRVNLIKKNRIQH